MIPHVAIRKVEEALTHQAAVAHLNIRSHKNMPPTAIPSAVPHLPRAVLRWNSPTASITQRVNRPPSPFTATPLTSPALCRKPHVSAMRRDGRLAAEMSS